MGEVTLEVEQAIKTLKLSQEIISKTETGFNESLYFNLLEKFVIGEDRRWWWVQEEFYPIYSINPGDIKAILDECFGFEYYIIDKKQTWLLCENHHNNLIGVGETLRQHNLAVIIDR